MKRRDAAYENICHYIKLARLTKNKLSKIAGIPRSFLAESPADRTIQKLADVTEVPKEIWTTLYETEVDFAKACLASVTDDLSPELIFATFDLLRAGKKAKKAKKPMKKYEVTYGIIGSVTLEVEADSEEDAKEKADELLSDSEKVAAGCDWDFVEWDGVGDPPMVPEFSIIEIEME